MSLTVNKPTERPTGDEVVTVATRIEEFLNAEIVKHYVGEVRR